MVTLDWRVESRAGVTLVELTVENPTDCARRVRVANRLGGAVWPPRREGVPVAGWDDGGFEGVLAPGDRRALGYASPAEPAEPPAELVWTERAGESERTGAVAFTADATSNDVTSNDATLNDATSNDATHSGTTSSSATPEGVVRSLGDPRPPADAVPRPAPGGASRTSPAADSASSIPEPVESWLSGVAERQSNSALTPEDDSALAAVARRIEDLRDSDASKDDASEPLTRRSP